MEKHFYICLADLTIQMCCRYDDIYLRCQDYLIDAPKGDADIVAQTTQEQIVAEQTREGGRVPAPHAEGLCLYRSIAEQLPYHDSFVFHGAAIEYEGQAYLFGAPSGTGKSTHISLWRDCLGDEVKIINGDKPILKIVPGGVLVCSTPWAGKEGWQRNCIVPLKAICILHQGQSNTIQRLCVQEHPELLLRQIYLPGKPDAAGRTLELLDTLCRRIPCYEMSCNISEQAAQISYEAMVGKHFPEQAKG